MVYRWTCPVFSVKRKWCKPVLCSRWRSWRLRWTSVVLPQSANWPWWTRTATSSWPQSAYLVQRGKAPRWVRLHAVKIFWLCFLCVVHFALVLLYIIWCILLLTFDPVLLWSCCSPFAIFPVVLCLWLPLSMMCSVFVFFLSRNWLLLTGLLDFESDSLDLFIYFLTCFVVVSLFKWMVRTSLVDFWLFCFGFGFGMYVWHVRFAFFACVFFVMWWGVYFQGNTKGGVLKMWHFRSQFTFWLSHGVRSVATGNQWSRIDFKTDFIGVLQRFPRSNWLDLWLSQRMDWDL